MQWRATRAYENKQLKGRLSARGSDVTFLLKGHSAPELSGAGAKRGVRSLPVRTYRVDPSDNVLMQRCSAFTD